ncbi:MAG: UDP-N-acetylmuramate dehydrogenase [Planctomycetota bacterium]|jgi:UDP-N-acetylmuramate dehydrogenase
MNIFAGLESIVKQDCPLAGYTWYGLGGNAEYLITPTTQDDLQTVIQRCNENNLSMRVLGFGSNLLVSDEGVAGAVIKLDGEQFSSIRFDGDCLSAGASAGLNKVTLECVRRGLSGLEALTGIPGSVGGAVKMNAGGNFGDIGTSVQSVTLIDSEGNIFEKSKPELIFNYRWTNITAKFILGAKIQLVEADKEQILRTLKEVWIYKKNSQPLNIKNAGCVFKNPRGLSAGALIDRAGLKDLQVGGAQVSEKHANFIITHKGCKAGDVKRLIDAVRQRVAEQFDVDLELEIEIW